MPSVLFVCTGNLFRSPIAEACFRRNLSEHEEPAGWKISSAGTWTKNGLSPASGALDMGQKIGLDIENHKSRIVTQEMLQASDLIIVMQASHREALRIEFPLIEKKIWMLSEIVENKKYDIPDPAEIPGIKHQELTHEIRLLIEKGCSKIIDLARKNEKIYGRKISGSKKSK